MRYRTDIDGLRAIAVAAIVLFHVNPTAFPGGFVGVDVFFVISGFLITASIRQQLEASTFNLAEFYARRARRLFPALFVSLAGTGGLAYMFLLPAELVEFSKSALATVTYVSNIFFYTRSDYFAPSADSSALLHTWSLSVEEQFYLLFPAFLILLRHHSRRGVITDLLLAAGISLAISQVLVRFDPPAGFFLSPSRFWQFLLGGATAMAVATTRPKPFHAHLIATAGMIGLIVCLATFRSRHPFPGIGAVPPTLAACLILYGGGSGTGLTGKVLSAHPLRLLGRWSYSVYLWHWPVIVFYRIAVNSTPTPVEQILLAITSIVLGALSYYLVEMPTRGLKISKPKSVIAGSLLATACIAAIAIVPIRDGGAPERFSPALIALSRYLDYDTSGFRPNSCFLSSSNSGSHEYKESECIVAADGRRSLLLMGDSHAAHFRAKMSTFFPDYNISQVTASGCKPLSPTIGQERCTTLIQRAVSQYIPDKKFDLIVISAQWASSDAPKLKRFLQEIGHGSRIVVVGPNAEYAVPLPRLLIQAELNESSGVIDHAINFEKAARIDAAMREAVATTTATYFSAINVQCPDKHCMTSSSDGVPYLFDKNHFTDEGAAVILSSLRKALETEPRRVSADDTVSP